MPNDLIECVNNISSIAKSKGIAHLYAGPVNSNLLNINHQNLVNFGSCSYLGLEFDKKLIDGAQRGLREYGTQFSTSRAYVSCGLYSELEAYFEQIFRSNIVVASTTTLGHLSAIPVLIQSKDAVILDHQVHSSVQTPVKQLKGEGVKVEMIRHSNMKMLESRIKKLKGQHDKIWYMCDGIYSMYGDKAPLDEIYALMDKYPQLHLYCDDAHGMSCFGDRGQGYVLGHQPIRERMVVAVSLAKAFASGGAVFAFSNKEWATKFRNAGGPMMASGPMQPSALGAAIESAKIHLSEKIKDYQEDLNQNILYTNMLIKKKGLPLAVENDSPVFFIGAGMPKMGYNLVERMVNRGYLSNLGIFPAVPMKNTGMRFTITRLHSFAQIESFIDAIHEEYSKALADEDTTMEEVCAAFNIKRQASDNKKEVESVVKQSELSLETKTSITDIKKQDWDAHYGNSGVYNWEGMRCLEATFSGLEAPEHNWEFDYIIIRDEENKIVMSTMLTTSLSKDDMLAPKEVSFSVEKERLKNPLYLASRLMTTGTPISMGEHLFIDYDHSSWEQAVGLFLKQLERLKKVRQADTVILRDFLNTNSKLNDIINSAGFFKHDLPNSNTISNLELSSEDYLKNLKSKWRKEIKNTVLDHAHKFEIKQVKTVPTPSQLDHWYFLYSNIKSKNMEVNTFGLPKSFFKNMAQNDHWEITEIYLNEIYDDREERKPVAVFFNYVCETTYHMMFVGQDYNYTDYSPYRQATYQSIKRAQELGIETVELGVTCDLEKRRFGAVAKPTWSYLQLEDHYNLEVIENVHKGSLMSTI